MRKQFYEKALPTQGIYCVALINPETKRVKHEYVYSINELELLLVKHSSQREQNVYVAPCSFENESRVAANAAFGRSFFIDLDVNHGNVAYLSKEEALSALDNFLNKNELPPPVRVDSGGGIQAYWLFEDEVPAEEWKILDSAPIHPFNPIAPKVTTRHHHLLMNSAPSPLSVPKQGSRLGRTEILRIVRFGVVGAFGTLLNTLLVWLVLSVGYNHLGWHPADHTVVTVAATFSWILCCGTNYLLNALWTFHHWPPHWRQALHYYSTALLSFFVQLLISLS